MSRIAVFVPNWVGDAVMSTPTLRALHRLSGPGGHVTGIMNATVAEVLRGSTRLSDVWHHDWRSRDARSQLVALIRRLRRGRFDLSVHLTNDFTSALAARLAGVPGRAGYSRNRRGWLLTHALQPRREGRRFRPVSALDYYLQIAYAVGCPPESPRMELAITAEDDRAVDAVWRSFGLRRDERVVLVNSSGAYGTAKLWPEEHCASLARRIADDLGWAVVVMCGPAERDRAGRIAAAACHRRVFSLAGEPASIGLSKACMMRARCLVSTDSGPRHFGAAFGVPVVALFGPTDPRWSDTHYMHEIRCSVEIDCRPCGQRECPERHHRCMGDLTPAMAFDAVRLAAADRTAR